MNMYMCMKINYINIKLNSPRARNRFNQVVEVKRFEVCSDVEKCDEFKNQTLKKIGWYIKML